MNRRSAFSRRAFLGGAATVVALPFLESLGGRSRARAEGPSVKRLMFFTFPAGVYQSAWNFADSLSPLVDAQLVGDVNLFTNIDNRPGNGPRGHTAGAGALLTCHHVPTIEDAGSQEPVNGVSIDQVAVSMMGCPASVELGTMTCPENPNVEHEYIPQYKDNYSWKSPTDQKQKLTDPRVAFERIFAGVVPSATEVERQKRIAQNKSVLDAVRSDATSLQKKLGAGDRLRLDEYFTGIRDVEKKLVTTTQAPKCTPQFNSTAIPDDPGAHAEIMLELTKLVHTCDLTRVSTFSYEYTTTPRAPFELSIGYDYHSNVTHHGENPEKVDAYKRHNKWCVKKFADFLTTLKTTIDPVNGQSLLSNSLVCFLSEISDGDAHSANGLPLIVAGQAGGAVTTGRTIDTKGKLSSVYLSMLEKLSGSPVASFGDDGFGPFAEF